MSYHILQIFLTRGKSKKLTVKKAMIVVEWRRAVRSLQLTMSNFIQAVN